MIAGWIRLFRTVCEKQDICRCRQIDDRYELMD